MPPPLRPMTTMISPVAMSRSRPRSTSWRPKRLWRPCDADHAQHGPQEVVPDQDQHRGEHPFPSGLPSPFPSPLPSGLPSLFPSPLPSPLSAAISTLSLFFLLQALPAGLPSPLPLSSLAFLRLALLRSGLPFSFSSISLARSSPVFCASLPCCSASFLASPSPAVSPWMPFCSLMILLTCLMYSRMRAFSESMRFAAVFAQKQLQQLVEILLHFALALDGVAQLILLQMATSRRQPLFDGPVFALSDCPGAAARCDADP